MNNENIFIGDDCWIGENACIIGAHVGKNCVIGANAVVTSNIPDCSAAVGVDSLTYHRGELDVGQPIGSLPLTITYFEANHANSDRLTQ